MILEAQNVIAYASNIFSCYQSRITLNEVRGSRLSGPPRHREFRLQSQLWVFDPNFSSSHGIVFPFLFFFSSQCQGDIPAVPRIKGKNRVSVWLILILWMQSFGSQLNMDIALYNIPPFGWALGLDSPLSSLKLPKQKPRFTGYGRCPRGEKNCDTLQGVFFFFFLQLLTILLLRLLLGIFFFFFN